MKKKDKIFVITSIAILLVAFAGLIIGYHLAGTNLLEFLGTKYAMYIYTALGVWLVVAIIYIVKEKVRKL